MTIQTKLRCLVLPVICCVITLFSCSNTPVAGNTSETTNGVTACIVTEDNTPAANAVVRLRSTDYFTAPPRLSKKTDVINADTIISGDTRTDEDGRFEINGIEPGGYLIEVSYDSTSAVLLECTIYNNDTADLEIQTLKPFASIVGRVDSISTAAYIQVRGMERLVTVDPTGRFTIDDLPEATLDLRIITTGEQYTEFTGVKVQSGDTASLTILPQWRFAKQLTLNTTSAGANVAENIYDFPLLVRLNGSNFVFSQAQVSGEDIRFLKTDGTMFRYEIEGWNAAEQQATIWVKIDTVYGNSDSQTFTMLWGNAAAASTSEGAAVFDTARGFRAVFHLDDTSDLSDASSNLGNGTNFNTANVQGITGGALEFTNGDTTYVSFPHKDNVDAAHLFENSTGCTFSWWMRPYEDLDTISGDTRRNIISKGVNWNDENDQDWALFFSEDTLLLEVHSEESSEPDKFATAGTPSASWEAQRWYHIAFTYDGEKVQWFIDGEPDGPAVVFDYPFVASDDKVEISIGRHYKGMPIEEIFDGILDEIRIANVKRSVGWIKLCYMNQKSTNSLVTFE